MNIIITLAGHSNRFAIEGYKTPKFLLKLGNKYMIEHVISMFDEDDDFIFILNNDQKKYFSKLKEIIKTIIKKSKFIFIKPHFNGPAYSIKMSNILDNLDNFIISYCDFFVNWNYKKFLRTVYGYKAAASSFKGFHPASFGQTYYAYMKVDKNNHLKELKEKESFTENRSNEHASTGVYYFESGKIFNKYYKKFFRDFKTNKKKEIKELYVSLILNYIVNDKHHVKIFEVEKFICFGTPKDCRQFNFWYDYFNNKKTKKNFFNQNQINLIPMAGEGNRFKQFGFNTNKPMISMTNQPMFKLSIDSLPQASSWIIVTLKKNNTLYSIKNILQPSDRYKKLKLIELSTTTDGMIQTCITAKKYFNKKQLLISSCDYIVEYDEKKWKEIINNKSTDVCIWTYKLSNVLYKDATKFAYCSVTKDNVKKIVEKKLISNTPEKDQMAIGVFWFRNKDDFLSCAEDAIKFKKQINGEYYIGNSINYLISKNKKVKIFEVDKWVSLGDPFELDVYQYWQNLFFSDENNM